MTTDENDDFFKKVLQEAQRVQKQYSRMPDVVGLGEGTTRVRLLPPLNKGAVIDEYKWGRHWIRNSQNKIEAVSGCRYVTYKDNCPICNAINRAISSTRDERTLELIKGWKPNTRMLLCVSPVEVNKPKPSDYQDPIILAITLDTYKSLWVQLQEMAKSEVNPLSLKDGRDVIFHRAGKGLNDTKYTVSFAPFNSAIDPAILEKRIDIGDYIARSFEDENMALNAIGSISEGLTGIPAVASTRSIANQSNVIDVDVVESAPWAGNVMDESEINKLLEDIK